MVEGRRMSAAAVKKKSTVRRSTGRRHSMSSKKISEEGKETEQSKIATLTRELFEEKNQVEKIKGILAEKRKQLDAVQAELETLRDESSHREAKISELEHTNQGLVAELRETRALLQESQAEASKYHEESLHLKTNLQNLTEEIKALATERDKLELECNQVLKERTELDTKYGIAKEANRQAQKMLHDALTREKERLMNVSNLDQSQIQAEQRIRQIQEQSEQQVKELEQKLAAQKTAFEGRLLSQARDHGMVKEELLTAKATIEELTDKLARPKPTIEVVRDQIHQHVKYLVKAMHDKISNEDAFKGGETLRWKVIQAKVDNLSSLVSRIFDALTALLLEKEACIQAKEMELSNMKEQDRSRQRQTTYVESQGNMLLRMFLPVPSRQQTTSMSLASSSATVSQTALRARLLISEVRSERVAEIIERARVWDSCNSTLLLAACVSCGAFFLDSDPAWPCPCGREAQLHAEHQEYSAFHQHKSSQQSIPTITQTPLRPILRHRTECGMKSDMKLAPPI